MAFEQPCWQCGHEATHHRARASGPNHGCHYCGCALTRTQAERGAPSRIQGPLDADEGTRRREQAIARMSAGQYRAWWIERATKVVQRIAGQVEAFTTDRLREELQRVQAPPPPGGEWRILGAVMRKAEADGWVVPQDEHELSATPQSHRRPKRVWRSTVFVKQGSLL